MSKFQINLAIASLTSRSAKLSGLLTLVSYITRNQNSLLSNAISWTIGKRLKRVSLVVLEARIVELDESLWDEVVRTGPGLLIVVQRNLPHSYSCLYLKLVHGPRK